MQERREIGLATLPDALSRGNHLSKVVRRRQGDDAARRQYELDLRRRLPFLPWAPVLFGSALKPDSVSEVFPLVDQVVTAFTRRIPTGLLNKFLQEVIAENPLPVRKGKPGKAVKSVYVTQVATQPPVFALFVGHPEDVGPTYLRFLEHRLRERFEFLGTSIRILVRRK